MKITKDNLRFTHNDGWWYCEVLDLAFIGITKHKAHTEERFKSRVRGWGWAETATKALYLAKMSLQCGIYYDS